MKLPKRFLAFVSRDRQARYVSKFQVSENTRTHVRKRLSLSLSLSLSLFLSLPESLGGNLVIIDAAAMKERIPCLPSLDIEHLRGFGVTCEESSMCQRPFADRMENHLCLRLGSERFSLMSPIKISARWGIPIGILQFTRCVYSLS